MIIQFLSQAKSELEGLGRRFWDEVDEHIAWIARNPEVSRLRPGGYRRYPEYWIDRPKAIGSPDVPR